MSGAQKIFFVASYLQLFAIPARSRKATSLQTEDHAIRKKDLCIAAPEGEIAAEQEAELWAFLLRQQRRVPKLGCLKDCINTCGYPITLSVSRSRAPTSLSSISRVLSFLPLSLSLPHPTFLSSIMLLPPSLEYRPTAALDLTPPTHAHREGVDSTPPPPTSCAKRFRRTEKGCMTMI